MADVLEKSFKSSISTHIGELKKEVTLLFTDIEDSTNYWHKHGDIEGRLMVDQHNRILFPLIKKFKGRLIKTIGDSIMAVFKKPHHALNAAIAMQQALHREEKEFLTPIKIRIGLHTGLAIVEENDVYGDVVNVAARVEGQSVADGIALSSQTLKALESKKNHYKFTKGEGFIPKGKSRKMALLFCTWQTHENLIKDYKVHKLIPFSSKQSFHILAYLLSNIILIYLLFSDYLRYFIVDVELFSSIILNPSLMLQEYPYAAALPIIVFLYILYRIFKIHRISQRFFKFLKGGFFACIIYILVQVSIGLIPQKTFPLIYKSIYKSAHLMVKIEQDNIALKSEPDTTSKTLLMVKKGTLLLLNDIRKVEDVVWNKIRLREGIYAWVERIRPERIGAAATRVSQTNTFFIYYKDIFILLLSLIGFIWGYVNFKVKPF